MSSTGEFKFPGTKSELEHRITAWSRKLTLPVSWLQGYITNGVLTTMLTRAKDAEGNSLFVVKGGAAMLIRFGETARATKDFDVAYWGGHEEISQSLATAFELPVWNFTASSRELDPYDGDRLRVIIYRYQISFKYLNDPFNSLTMEVTLQRDAESEKVNAVLDLSPVRLPNPTELELLEITQQIAEKWHACTEPDKDGIPNYRVTDVYDLFLLLGFTENCSLESEVIQKCKDVFIVRNVHKWPTKITLRNGWVQVWDNICANQPVEVLRIPTGINEAITELNQKLFGSN